MTDKEHMANNENPILVEIAKSPNFSIREGVLVEHLIENGTFKTLIDGIESDEAKKVLVSGIVDRSVEDFTKKGTVSKIENDISITYAGKLELVNPEDHNLFVYQCMLELDDIEGINKILSIDTLIYGKNRVIRENAKGALIELLSKGYVSTIEENYDFIKYYNEFVNSDVAAKATDDADEKVINELLNTKPIENKNVIITELLKSEYVISRKALLNNLYESNAFKPLINSLSAEAYADIIQKYVDRTLIELSEYVEIIKENSIKLTHEGKKRLLNLQDGSNYVSLMTPKQSKVIQRILENYSEITDGPSKEAREHTRDTISRQISDAVYVSKEYMDEAPIVKLGILKRLESGEIKNETVLNTIIKAKYAE